MTVRSITKATTVPTPWPLVTVNTPTATWVVPPLSRSSTPTRSLKSPLTTRPVSQPTRYVHRANLNKCCIVHTDQLRSRCPLETRLVLQPPLPRTQTRSKSSSSSSSPLQARAPLKANSRLSPISKTTHHPKLRLKLKFHPLLQHQKPQWPDSQPSSST